MLALFVLVCNRYYYVRNLLWQMTVMTVTEHLFGTEKKVSVRIAENKNEIEAAQRLRYKVFYEEYHAEPSEKIKSLKRDIDQYDDIADHMIVIDENIKDKDSRVVGTYRLLRHDVANLNGGFYTGSEYNIKPLLDSGCNLLELGRSCVLPEYRTKPIIQLLWKGISSYITNHNIDVLFGCGSIHETDISKISESLAYLYHYHLSHDGLRPCALRGQYVDMNLHSIDEINVKRAFNALPPLIKGYIRLGAKVGDGAVIDPVFKTTDVCIVLETEQIASRYKNHYSTGNNLVGNRNKIATVGEAVIDVTSDLVTGKI